MLYLCSPARSPLALSIESSRNSTASHSQFSLPILFCPHPPQVKQLELDVKVHQLRICDMVQRSIVERKVKQAPESFLRLCREHISTQLKTPPKSIKGKGKGGAKGKKADPQQPSETAEEKNQKRDVKHLLR